MRNILFILMAMTLSISTVSADPLAAQKPSNATTVRKPLAAKHARGNPCAVYGPGFAKIDGTETCIKIGGAVSIGVGGAVRH
jgi:hypothetical protein